MKPCFLVVDKPAGVTSHDVVATLRAVTGERKVGHTGTLDPFATGVLVLAFGAATRLIAHLDEREKVYDATIAFGTRMDTGDPTGEVLETAEVPELDEDTVDAALATFVGPRMQAPPAYSAVKHQGKPLYWYARRGEKVEVPARPIEVFGMERLALSPGRLRVRITCSRGTYARVLAEEIAEALGTVGHLEALARDASGPFRLEDALSMDDLARLVAPEAAEAQGWEAVLLARGRGEERVAWAPRPAVREGLAPWIRAPIAALHHMPIVDVDEGWARRVVAGHAPPMQPAGLPTGTAFLVAHGEDILALAETGPQHPKLTKGLVDSGSGGRGGGRRRRRG